MSFLSNLFGGGGSSRPSFMPRATPSAPRIGGGAGESRVREDRRRKNVGEDETQLTGLGSVGAQEGDVKRSTLLGSAAG